MRSLFRHSTAVFALIALVRFACPPLQAEDASGEIPGVTVGKVDIGASLEKQLTAEGKAAYLGRVVEALNATLSSDFGSTGRFQMIEATDRTQAIIDEQNFNKERAGNVAPDSGGRSGQMIGASYLISTQITSYLDNVAELKVASRNQLKYRRTVELSGVVQIVNVATRRIFATVNPKVRVLKIYDISPGLTMSSSESDEVLDQLVRAYSQKVVGGVMDRLNPYVVISVRDKRINIDAGDTSGIAKDQVWEFYAVEEIVHPVTKKKIRDETLVGSGRVIAVRADRSTLEAIEDNGIAAGAVARPKDDAPPDEK